ncbi:hypothetical protein AAMO2058_001590300 [Amorphochlora amoebiformis]
MIAAVAFALILFSTPVAPARVEVGVENTLETTEDRAGHKPTKKPTWKASSPTKKPTWKPPSPTKKPTWKAPSPTKKPTWKAPSPTKKPTWKAPSPTKKPTWKAPSPTKKPTWKAPSPTKKPTWKAPSPTKKPTWKAPSPTKKPTWKAPSPTKKPTWKAPSPTKKPTWKAPSPTKKPTWKASPTKKPTWKASPTKKPTWKASPTKKPTWKATPTKKPTWKASPTKKPTWKQTPPTKKPTWAVPTKKPTKPPIDIGPPTPFPFERFTETPTTGIPSVTPSTVTPTTSPSQNPVTVTPSVSSLGCPGTQGSAEAFTVEEEVVTWCTSFCCNQFTPACQNGDTSDDFPGCCSGPFNPTLGRVQGLPLTFDTDEQSPGVNYIACDTISDPPRVLCPQGTLCKTLNFTVQDVFDEQPRPSTNPRGGTVSASLDCNTVDPLNLASCRFFDRKVGNIDGRVACIPPSQAGVPSPSPVTASPTSYPIIFDACVTPSKVVFERTGVWPGRLSKEKFGMREPPRVISISKAPDGDNEEKEVTENESNHVSLIEASEPAQNSTLLV